jgi:hypothetical protein
LTSIVMLLVLPAAPAMLAQTTAPVTIQPPSDLVVTGGAILQSFDVDELVRDAPYSAEGTTEIVQTLIDGNRIVRHTSASVARDSRGRVRREQTLAAVGAMIVAGDAHTVTISDPASRTSYLLDPQRRVAILHRTLQGPTTRLTPDDAKPIMRAEKPIGGTEKSEGPVFRTFAGPGVEILGLGGVSVSPGGPVGASNAMTESLGRQEIEGVTAEGTRTTITIPPGAIGNERAIESIYERWFSRDLRVVVLSRSVDPRFGETTYRLTEISRGEPASWLFEVPADYRIVEDRPPR